MSFCVEMPDPNDAAAMEEFQKLMDMVNEETDKEIDSVMEKYGVDFETANAVVYLRSRSRWTQEKENELLEWKKTEPFPNIMEWGH